MISELFQMLRERWCCGLPAAPVGLLAREVRVTPTATKVILARFIEAGICKEPRKGFFTLVGPCLTSVDQKFEGMMNSLRRR